MQSQNILGRIALGVLLAWIGLSPAVLADSRPEISNYTPQSGSAGTAVTILGKNFGNRGSASTVWFGAAKSAQITLWSRSQVVAKAPAGSGEVKLRVVNAAGQSSGGKSWKYTTSGGGGTTGGGGTGTGGTSGLTNFKVFANNDLGMHCVDKDFSVFSILPPFNVVNAQVLGQDANGKPRLLKDTDGIVLQYSPIADAAGSINSKSLGKTNFWDYAAHIYGANLALGQGLKGLYMPGDVPGGTAVASKTRFGWDTGLGLFAAPGVPIVPTDDAGKTNRYPLLRVAAADASGKQLAATDAVLPVSDETTCSNCHATGKIAAPTGQGTNWSAASDAKDVQSRTNILILHDKKFGTTLQAAAPVLCASCHYSPALDLAGTGPSLEQQKHRTMSSTMHADHADKVLKITTAAGRPILDQPTLKGQTPVPADQQACYQCHPGTSTKCLRGAMTETVECQNCHGGMKAVGGTTPMKSSGTTDFRTTDLNRKPWGDEPRCQSCHTGDAVSHIDPVTAGVDNQLASDGLRLLLSHDRKDPAASPLLAANKRFAENDGKLFRHSKGHGGMACESCHGSTHAIWPTDELKNPNDSVAAKQAQGHAGTIAECTTCHRDGTLPTSGSAALNGPHGLHVIGNARFADGGHESLAEGNLAACQTCHGKDYRGTVLSKTTADRTFSIEGRTKSLPKGTQVGCYTCHDGPNGD